MKPLFALLFLLLSISFDATAQEDAKTLHETAKTYLIKGDYDNAILVLNRALQLAPSDLEMLKDLAFALYLKRDFTKSIEISKQLIVREDADVPCYQILALNYKSIALVKECTKLYKDGLARFPGSGVLYNEYGELMGAEGNMKGAVEMWEKSIEIDPNHSSSYYNAAKFYVANNNIVKAILYAENFVNLESFTNRTKEMKELLYSAYKKLFIEVDLNQLIQSLSNHPFHQQFIANLRANHSVTTTGINTASLTALRTRFIVYWFEKMGNQYPYRLFDHHRQLLSEGLFNAYNYWLFGEAENDQAYNEWMNSQADETRNFQKFQRSRIYKIPTGQYYK